MGINFIDTAPTYDQGHSEEFIGRAIKGKRHQVIIATKFGSMMNEAPSKRGSSRHNIMDTIDASLNQPMGSFVDGSGALYIADTKNNRIRKADPWGTIITVAGNGTTDPEVPRWDRFSGDGGLRFVFLYRNY